MAKHGPSQQDQEDTELLLDRIGTVGMLILLANICTDKAKQVNRRGGDDEGIAEFWIEISESLTELADETEDLP